MVLCIGYINIESYPELVVVSRVWFESSSGEWLIITFRDSTVPSDIAIESMSKQGRQDRLTFIAPTITSACSVVRTYYEHVWLDLAIIEKQREYYRYVDWWRNRYFGVRGEILNVIEETEHPPLYTIVPTQLSGFI